MWEEETIFCNNLFAHEEDGWTRRSSTASAILNIPKWERAFRLQASSLTFEWPQAGDVEGAALAESSPVPSPAIQALTSKPNQLNFLGCRHDQVGL